MNFFFQKNNEVNKNLNNNNIQNDFEYTDTNKINNNSIQNLYLNNNIVKNELYRQLFFILLFFIILAFIFYLFLKKEKTGWISIKNNYLLFFLALIPVITLSFSYNFFHYYIEENLTKHIEKIVENFYLLNKIPKIKKGDENYNDFLIVQSILFTTLVLASSQFFSLLTKFILEKGIINFKHEDELTKNNLLFNFLGILIGGFIYMLFYFLIFYKKRPIKIDNKSIDNIEKIDFSIDEKKIK